MNIFRSQDMKRSRRSVSSAEDDSLDLGFQLVSARIMEPNQLLFKNDIESGYVTWWVLYGCSWIDVD